MKLLICKTASDVEGLDLRLGEIKFKLNVPEGTGSWSRYFEIYNNSDGYVRLDSGAKFSDNTNQKPYDKTTRQRIFIPVGEYNVFFSNKYFFEDYDGGEGFNTEHIINSSELWLQKGNFKQSPNLKRVMVGNLKGCDGALLNAKEVFLLERMTTFTCIGVTHNTLNLGLSDFTNSENIEKIDIRYQNNVTGKLSDLANLISLKNITFTALHFVTGDISILSNLVSLERLILDFTSVDGDLESLLEGLLASGRTSGSLHCDLEGSGVKFNSQSQGVGSTYDAVFGDNGISVSKGGNIVASYDGTTWTYV